MHCNPKLDLIETLIHSSMDLRVNQWQWPVNLFISISTKEARYKVEEIEQFVIFPTSKILGPLTNNTFAYRVWSQLKKSTRLRLLSGNEDYYVGS